MRQQPSTHAGDNQDTDSTGEIPRRRTKHTGRLRAKRKLAEISSSDASDSTPPTTLGTQSTPASTTLKRKHQATAPRRKKPRILSGLESQNFIHIDSDEDTPEHPIHATRGARRGRRPDVIYSAAYHPIDEALRPNRTSARNSCGKFEHSNDGDDSNDLELHSSSGSDDTFRRKKRAVSKHATQRPTRASTQRQILYDQRIHSQDNVLLKSGIMSPKRRRKRNTESSSVRDTTERSTQDDHGERQHSAEPSLGDREDNGILISSEDPITSEDTNYFHEVSTMISSDARRLLSEHNFGGDADNANGAPQSQMSNLAELTSQASQIIQSTRCSPTKPTKTQALQNMHNFKIYEDSEELSTEINLDERRAFRTLRKLNEDRSKENEHEGRGAIPSTTDEELTSSDEDGLEGDEMHRHEFPSYDEEVKYFGLLNSLESVVPMTKAVKCKSQTQVYRQSLHDLLRKDAGCSGVGHTAAGGTKSVSSGGHTEVFERQQYLAMPEDEATAMEDATEKFSACDQDDNQLPPGFFSSSFNQEKPSLRKLPNIMEEIAGTTTGIMDALQTAIQPNYAVENNEEESQGTVRLVPEVPEYRFLPPPSTQQKRALEEPTAKEHSFSDAMKRPAPTITSQEKESQISGMNNFYNAAFNLIPTPPATGGDVAQKNAEAELNVPTSEKEDQILAPNQNGGESQIVTEKVISTHSQDGSDFATSVATQSDKEHENENEGADEKREKDENTADETEEDDEDDDGGRDEKQSSQIL